MQYFEEKSEMLFEVFTQNVYSSEKSIAGLVIILQICYEMYPVMPLLRTCKHKYLSFSF